MVSKESHSYALFAGGSALIGGIAGKFAGSKIRVTKLSALCEGFFCLTHKKNFSKLLQ